VLLGPQWSLKGEWLYADFGNIPVSGDASSGFAHITAEAEVKANLLRVGIDYKF
jgi:outer membrane immunogenic protein